MEIKYFVRTIESSNVNLPIEYEEILDTEHLYVKSFINALYKINDYNAVLMEDDIEVCSNFQEEIEKVINRYPENVINFFSKPERYFTTHFSDLFVYNQCTYFPKGFAKKLANRMMKFYLDERKYPKRQRYGQLLSIALIELHIPHLIYRPCLVQHIDGKSTFDGSFCKRNTIWYKEYLDKLGIDMIEAYSEENQEKLKELLELDRKRWYGEDYEKC